MIDVRGICKAFKDQIVLDGVTLQVRAGEVVAVLGTSGSGKSTLVRCINGLDQPDSGQVFVDGLCAGKPAELLAIRKKCATVFQHFNLYPHLSVLDNITLAPRCVLKQSRPQAEEFARVLLDRVGISGHADKFPSMLSGGQKQRVGICRALAMKPDYLLLDEITSALDPEMAAEVLGVMVQLAKEGVTMVAVTHAISFAREISSRIVFIERGKVLVDLPTLEFFAAGGGRSHPRIDGFLAKAGGM